MVLSIVIVNWNTKDELGACLRSIESHPPSEDFEVIVVDNASIDESAERVRSEFPWVKLIAAPRNLGYAKGNNLGFEVAQGEYVLTLNPDTEVFESSLDEALRAIRKNPRYGVIAGQLIGPNGEIQASVRGFPTLIGIVGDLTGLGKVLPHSPFGSYRLPAFDYKIAQDAPQPMGTFLLFRREALVAVGDPKRPFDESFPIFFNEVDLLKRLADEDFRCRYDPAIRLQHVGGAGTRQARKSMIWESHRSLIRFLWKHESAGVDGIARIWRHFAVGTASVIIWIAALIRARGFHAGFRP